MRARGMGFVLILISMVLFVLSGCTTASTPAAPSPAAKPVTQAANTEAKAPAAAPPVKLEKIKAAYTAFSGDSLPWWVAKEQGIFEKYGLDAELVYIAGSTTAMQSMLGGDVDFIVGGSTTNVVSAAVAGGDAVMMAVVKNSVVFFLMVDPSIKTIADLKGKKLGVTKFGSLTDFSLRWALNKLGLTPDKDVTILQMNEMPAILAGMQSKAIDGGPLSSPTDLEARKAGFSELVDVGKLGLEYPGNGIATTRAVLKNKTEIARNFAKATIEAIYTLKTNRDVSIKALQKYLKNDDPAVLEATNNTYGPLFEKLPYPKGAQIAVDEVAKTNPKAVGRDPNEFIDTSLVAELEKSGFIDNIYSGKK